MATKPAAAPSPAPLSAPAPLPAGRTALAPTVVPMPEGTVDPVKALNERQAASLAKIATARRTAEGDDREGPPPPPKASKTTTETPSSAPSGSAVTSKPGSPKTAAASPEAKTDASRDPATPGEAPPKDGSPASTPKELKYDLKSLARWAEKDPEAAKEFGEKVLKVKVDEEWIKLSNKRRKLREDVREQSAAGIRAAEEKLALVESQKKVLDDAVDKLSPVADLWDAVGERVRNNMAPDFEAGDAAFLANTGITVDDYMKARARRGIINPEMARLKAENARLKRETETKKAPEPEKPKPVEPEEKPKAAEPNKKAPDWSEDVEKKHPLRKFEGWRQDLAEAMAKHYDEDLDEYDADVEDVANELAKKKLAEAAGEDEVDDKPKPKKAKRPPADAPQFNAKKVKAKEDDEDEDDSDAELIKDVKGPTDPQKRMRWAMERAQARARRGDFAE